MRRTIQAIVLVLMFAVLGCGYSTRSALPSPWKTIYIPPFANKIDFTTESKRNLYLPLLELKVRQAIMHRFQFDGNLKVANQDKADLVLTGELLDYTRGALRYNDSYDVQEYRIQIVVRLKLTEGVGGPVVWEESSFVGEASYFLSGPQAKSENAALEEALTDLARRVVERTVENW